MLDLSQEKQHEGCDTDHHRNHGNRRDLSALPVHAPVAVLGNALSRWFISHNLAVWSCVPPVPSGGSTGGVLCCAKNGQDREPQHSKSPVVGKMSGVEKRRSDFSLPVAVSQVFTCPPQSGLT